MAQLSWWMFAVGAFVFVVTIGMLAVAVSLHRVGRGRPLSWKAGAVVVIVGGVAAPLLAVVAVTVSGGIVGSETEGRSEVSGPTVEVIGRRWWWEFRYLDEEGGPPVVTANELRLPVGRRARLRLISDNVIHSFWAPNLQGKTDLIPGQVNVLFAEPETVGVWRGQCAEFCGLQHAMMGFVIVAEEQEAFDDWLAGQAAPARVADHPGLRVFKSSGCGECHAIRGAGLEGGKGPDLTHLASRSMLAAATLPNTAGNLGGWITNPQSIKPGALMPPSAPPPEQLFALIDFLQSLE